jgi:hypothetical protein
MTVLFDRKYKLTVGLPPSLVEVDIFSPPMEEGTTQADFVNNQDWRTLSVKNAVEITDLQIQANIKSNSNSTSNTSKTTISIYNLSKRTIDIIAKTNNYVILEAGYAQDKELEMIFSGQVRDVVTTRQGQDLITELFCEDAYTPNNYIKISKKFTRDNTYGQVLKYLVDKYAENGITTGDFIDDWADVASREVATPNSTKILAKKAIPQEYAQTPVVMARPANTKTSNGLVLMGYLHQALDKVCAQMGYVNYITNGRLFVHPKGYTKMVEQFELSTKIMKSIRPMGSKSGGGSLGKGIEGISITTFLDGRLDVDKSIKILDGDHAGEYKIITKEHKLDYEGSSWDTLITCTKFD